MHTIVGRLARRAAASHAHSTRSFHATSTALARQSRRGGSGSRLGRSKPAPTATDFEHEFDNDDDSERLNKAKKTATFFTKDELEEDPDMTNKLADAVDDDDDADLEGEDTKQFLKGVDELFVLGEKEFDRRITTIDVGDDEEHDSEREDAAFDDDDSETAIDRAERIPKKRLMRVLDEFDAKHVRTGKNAESMPVPKPKTAAPLEKKTKKIDPERISHRQEKVEGSVSDYVQNLLIEDSDMLETDVFAHIVDASVSPDLRRIVLFWEPARRNSVNQIIGKKKAEGVQKRLEKLEKWIRLSVTRHLNLKYSPVIQFKRRKEPKVDKIREMFDQEMAWLDRFK